MTTVVNTEELKAKLYNACLDIDEKTRAQVIQPLNQTLTVTLDLKTQVKQAHWNVKGMNFYQLHELFDEIASTLEEYTDMIAERITALARLALGTTRVTASESILLEYPFDIVNGKDHVSVLADRMAIYMQHHCATTLTMLSS